MKADTMIKPTNLRATNGKEYVAAWEEYIADCIDIDGDESPSLKAKLEHAAMRFRSEYGDAFTRKKYPNLQQRLSEYLMGLPFGFAYNYRDITNAACRLHGVASLTESQADKIRDKWFNHCAIMLLRVADRHGVSFT